MAKRDDCGRVYFLTSKMEQALEREDIETFVHSSDERAECVARLSARTLTDNERQTLARTHVIDERISVFANRLLADYRKRLQHFDANAKRIMQYESGSLNVSQGQVIDNKR